MRRTRRPRTIHDHAGAICKVVDQVEARCIAADDAVTPTLQEMTEAELRRLWRAADAIRRPERHGVIAAASRLQGRICEWLRTRFGSAVLMSRAERAARVVEEAVELAQAEGVDEIQVWRILNRAYERKPGDSAQEAAGVAVTLLAWAAVAGVDLDAVTHREVDRIEGLSVEHFRRKHAEKAAAGTALAGTPPEAR